MFENIRLAFQGVWSHKLRSMLTMLGIIIGIAAIITIVSTIKGTNEQIKQNLIGAGNNVVAVQLNQSGYPYDLSWNQVPAGVRPISDDTRKDLEDIDGAQKVTIYHSRNYSENVFYQNSQFNGSMYGVDEHYFGTYGYQIRTGRGFTASDYEHFRKVAIVDANTVSGLFTGTDPVGQAIEIQGEVFTVIGVVAMSQEFTPTINSMSDYWMYSGSSAGSIFIPDPVWPTAYRFDEPQNVAIKVENTDVMTTVGKSAADLLTQRQIVGDSSDFDYRSQDMLEQAQQLQKMSQATNTQLVWIASISLLVGGIGVMNIMLVSVTERTREIGTRKALGAPNSAIRMQFITESIVLCSIGGIIGMLLGTALGAVLSKVMQAPARPDPAAILIAVGFSMTIGIFFGYYPANKAAKMDPIEALRYE